MLVLGLDTCLSACSVAVLDDARVLAWKSETMARGHQERLAPMAQAVMAEAGVAFDRLERIGATVGPGSFTGLRVGIAFAKGLSSALGIPAAGVGTLEALATVTNGLVAAAIDARREQVYLQVFEDGAPLMAPDVLALGTAAARLAELAMGRPLTLVGSGAPLLVGAAAVLTPDGCDPRAVARLAAARPAAPLAAALPARARREAAGMKLIPATPAQAEAMASAHAQAFDTPWTSDDFEDLLDGDGVFGLLAADEDPMGVILCRVAAGEVEVLTLAVPPWARRRGVARALMNAALGLAKQSGAEQAFLEVDVDNDAAIGLYERLGFRRTGLRKAYYDRGPAGYADALVMRLDLT